MTQMPDEIRFRVMPDGSLQVVYRDDLETLLPDFTRGVTKRATHVEPAGHGWVILGHDHVFPTRAAALAWEVENIWSLVGGSREV